MYYSTCDFFEEIYSDFTIVDAVTPEGDNIIANGHYEFHVDEEKLDALIVELFYAPKKR